jgi:hypothetical protein
MARVSGCANRCNSGGAGGDDGGAEADELDRVIETESVGRDHRRPLGVRAFDIDSRGAYPRGRRRLRPGPRLTSTQPPLYYLHYLYGGDPVLYQHLFLTIKLYTIPAIVVSSASPFRFDTFNSLYKQQFSNADLPSQSFLEWLVGFAEGDGSFTVNSRGTCIFVITQSTSDLQVLEYIQRVLGFGRVIKQGPRTSRYVVEDIASVTLLIALFNGNLVFPLKQANFALFLEAFNKRSRAQLVEFISPVLTPTFNDSWLSGITDAEGCFNCSFLGNSTAYRFRFLLAQLGEINLPVLTHITTLIGGVVRPHAKLGVNELTVNGARNIDRVFKYFDTHSLYTKKVNSYRLWREVHTSIINGEHLSPVLRATLKAKAATINSLN